MNPIQRFTGAIALSVLLLIPGFAARAQTAADIPAIQGESFHSPASNQAVTDILGIVTDVRDRGFYLQDPLGDGNDRTSDALFVFTDSAPSAADGTAIAVGDGIAVSGRVVEFPSNSPLGLTEILATRPGEVERLDVNQTLPEATTIGAGGRVPPTEVIDDDSFDDYEPGTEGLDFYESLEGMRVRLNNPLAVGANFKGEFPVVVDGGVGATVLSSTGGLVVGAGDLNPERLWIDPLGQPARVSMGDRFDGPVEGILAYSSRLDHYTLFATEPLPEILEQTPVAEITDLVPGGDRLTVAAYNVKNLTPRSGDRLKRIATGITQNLQAPDIIALVEVQDSDGGSNSGTIDADRTYAELGAAIVAAGGPAYRFTDIAPKDDLDGGMPGGNIRVGFAYNPERVSLVDLPAGNATTPVVVVEGPNGADLSLNPGRLDPKNPAFVNSRKPVAAEFEFQGNKIFVIGNHFNSKRGDDPLFGDVQPPNFNSEVQRGQQAAVVQGFVRNLLGRDPEANVIVLGDLNDFQFSPTLATLAGDNLTNLSNFVPEADRFSLLFDGNLQLLDHLLVSSHLLFEGNAEYDIVHFNAGFPGAASDHDPVLARFTLPAIATDRADEPGDIPKTDPNNPDPNDSDPQPDPEAGETIFPGLTGPALLGELA